MKIERVAVCYGELRSAGFNNARHEVALAAILEKGETAESVKSKLQALAKMSVKKAFGDADANQTELDIPF